MSCGGPQHSGGIYFTSRALTQLALATAGQTTQPVVASVGHSVAFTTPGNCIASQLRDHELLPYPPEVFSTHHHGKFINATC